jgi:hypothetical protein
VAAEFTWWGAEAASQLKSLEVFLSARFGLDFRDRDKMASKIGISWAIAAAYD